MRHHHLAYLVSFLRLAAAGLGIAFCTAFSLPCSATLGWTPFLKGLSITVLVSLVWNFVLVGVQAVSTDHINCWGVMFLDGLAFPVALVALGICLYESLPRHSRKAWRSNDLGRFGFVALAVIVILHLGIFAVDAYCKYSGRKPTTSAHQNKPQIAATGCRRRPAAFDGPASASRGFPLQCMSTPRNLDPEIAVPRPGQAVTTRHTTPASIADIMSSYKANARPPSYRSYG